MVEHDDRTALTLFTPEGFAAGAALRLDDDAARHAHVRRARQGDRVRLIDGKGRVGDGAIESISRQQVTVAVERVLQVPRPSELELIIPVADKDRMLMAAEKAAELQITAWRPARFARSRSVSARGEGEKFQHRVRARMLAALEQSGGAWMPEVHDEADGTQVLAAIVPRFTRLILDRAGASVSTVAGSGPAALAVGPEGGFEPAEIEAARASGFVPASLGPMTLRFETAVIAGLAVIRAARHSSEVSRGD